MFFLFVLNLPVAMLNTIVGLLIVFLLSWPPAPLAQQVMVTSPLPGEAVQGQTVIRGTTDIEELQSYEVSFSYQGDETNTWFPIGRGTERLKDQSLATWDTTTISDGEYRLRVRVFLEDGRTLETVVSGLRVRNYSPVETSTPEPLKTVSVDKATQPAVDFTPSGPETADTSSNPAGLTSDMLGNSLVRGGLIAIGLFILLGIYLGIRGLARRG